MRIMRVAKLSFSAPLTVVAKTALASPSATTAFLALSPTAGGVAAATNGSPGDSSPSVARKPGTATVGSGAAAAAAAAGTGGAKPRRRGAGLLLAAAAVLTVSESAGSRKESSGSREKNGDSNGDSICV